MDEGKESNSAIYVSGGSQANPPRLAFVTAPFPGVRRVGQEGVKLGLWSFTELTGPDIKLPPADIYILGAWHPAYERLLKALLPFRIWICWTSSAGEMDMEPVEIGYLQEILQDARIEKVWFGDYSLAAVYQEKGFYAPYPLSPNLPLYAGPKSDAIALFNPGGSKKNCLNQILAVALFQRQHPEWVLETNVSNYEQEMKNLGLRYRLHPWLPAEEYHQVLGGCRINLACSWAETNSYQVAEAGLLGVPSVISCAIPQPGITCFYPNSPEAIYDCMEVAIKETPLVVRGAVENCADNRNRQLQEAWQLSVIHTLAAIL